VVKAYYEKLSPGKRIALVINGRTQVTGYIDKRVLKPSRNEGHVLTVSGRDAILPLLDSGADPTYYFT
jgi:prophage tail gpP-like protein